jgi:hypothetical protein
MTQGSDSIWKKYVFWRGKKIWWLSFLLILLWYVFLFFVKSIILDLCEIKSSINVYLVVQLYQIFNIQGLI